MRSDDLSKEQARALKNKIGPMLNYLCRLQRRMRYRGFLESDPLLQRVVEASNAVHALHVELHYLDGRKKNEKNHRPLDTKGRDEVKISRRSGQEHFQAPPKWETRV